MRGVLWQTGFRPFFLLAGGYAALFVPLWLAIFMGAGQAPSWLAATRWHAHEMLFGVVCAAAAGFLLTAVPTWTSTRPVSGPGLAGLALLWLAGRAAMLGAGALPPTVVALIDVAFLPALCAAVAVPIVRRRQWRNAGFPVLLAALALANLALHAEAHTFLLDAGARATRLAVLAVALLVAVIGGRIVPAFTANALRRRGIEPRLVSRPWLERAVVPALLAVAALEAAAPRSAASGAACALAAGLLALRMSGWRSGATLGDPLLWSLHLGYAWLPAGLLGIALGDLGAPVPWTVGLHALTQGAFGTMILAVMTRVSLGHTGRPLAAPPSAVAAYVLVSLAALVRCAGVLLAPAHGLAVVATSGALWTAAFAAFLAGFAPILLAPRADGAPG